MLDKWGGFLYDGRYSPGEHGDIEMSEYNLTRLKELIDLFEFNIKQYKGRHYDEAKTRADFIDKFFLLLGWDVYNEHGYSEQYRDVVREDRVEVKGKVKAPDYCFRIGGVRKFFVEAKKPSVDIKYDVEPAFQLRRYAYTAKLPLSILTDFEEFAVYDTRLKPHKNDAASTARIFYCTHHDYRKEFDFIFHTFSREGILKGSFDRYIEDTGRKKGTSEVDREFLKLIESWRDSLARNIALRNKALSIYELNYAVQKIIDRIIFLRIAEDRQVEDYARLQEITAHKGDLYPCLIRLFLQADVKYNSGLFDFKADQLTPRLKIDDRVLKEIIKSIYYPDSPYEFSVFDVEILGNIYEQFLGKTIRLTAGHQAKVEDKPEVKKAGGVYYTPKYIVDYIVKNTVGTLLGTDKGSPRTPGEIEKIKILDPACGSGSFLLGAYQLLLDYHLDYYTREKNIKKALKDNNIYQLGEREYRLTIAEKHRILLNNIFGVDIDSQAVEVTKLSLLLKLMEGESQESTGMLFKYSDIKLLPDLSANIKCGNSLIGSDFYQTGQMSLFQDEDTVRRINVFDWNKEFPHILSHGGFDAIIGNPPYVDIKGMPVDEVDFLFKTYKTANKRINLFSIFFEKMFNIVNQESFRIAMIVPTALISQESYKEIRKLILENYKIVNIVRLPNESFGSSAGEVKVDTVIIVLGNYENNKKLTEIIGYKGYDRIKAIETVDAFLHTKIDQCEWKFNNEFAWTINTNSRDKKLFEKIENNTIPLERVAWFSLGITPYDKYKGHTQKQIKEKIFHSSHKKDEFYKKLLAGNDVKRYYVRWNGKQWIRYGAWLGAPREQKFFTSKRILVKQIIDWSSKRIWATLTEEELYNTQNAFNLISKGDLKLEYLLGIINSKLITYYHRKIFLDEFKMRFQKILIKDCRKFPIYKINVDNFSEKSKYNDLVEMVEGMLGLQEKFQGAKMEREREVFRKQIDILDRQIDQLVYELYGLTHDEIKIVEESATSRR
jgi:adenine-specific DNA-methyltransferase